ncbi:MAG: ATP-binding cassette domain-containing protein, partial [Bacteroidales bacterium]|nr:ATP-binding cassette domain-containing protein [Bacteroidales bacterium]
NILFPLQNLKGENRLSKEEMLTRVTKAAKLVQIEEYLKRKPSELSGGQQQRVAIARAVVSNPKLILADEPTGNLDSKNGSEVMRILSELNAEGTTIVMVTHSKHDASLAHRIVNLFDGSVVASVGAFV